MKRLPLSPVSVLQAEETCCQCGMVKGEWTANQGRGYEKEGYRYCCERCADETGCSCFEAVRLAARPIKALKSARPHHGVRFSHRP